MVSFIFCALLCDEIELYVHACPLQSIEDTPDLPGMLLIEHESRIMG
jgi:hypothetical protein